MYKRKILILYDYFDPAYKAGGPIRSLVNLVKLMERQLDIYILTSNQDHDGEELQVEPDQWIGYGISSQVMYLSKEGRGFTSIKKILSNLKPEVVYLNGIFSLSFVVYPLWILRKWGNTKIIIAPRGMLQSESLAIKPIKKKVYLKLLKSIFLHANIYWQMTTKQEQIELLSVIKNPKRIHVIGNVPYFRQHILIKSRERKKRSVLGTVALISPMKNILLILKALANITYELEYQLYGPVKDQLYWSDCQKLIDRLPQNIQISYKGEVNPAMVGEVISGFDFYIQPSKSENFGHSIFEAFNQGIPVIISDQTLWKGLKLQKAGWDVNLNNPKALEKAILEAINIDDETYAEYRKGARRVAEKYMRENDFKNDYLKLFGKD